MKARRAIKEPSTHEVDEAVDLLRLLADAARLRMLWSLSEGQELDVTTLAAVAGVRQPSASQHLAKLRLAGAVEMRRDGRRALYRIRGVHMRRVIAEALSHAEHSVSGDPHHD